MADMYGNYDEKPQGASRLQMARTMDRVAMAFSSLAKDQGYEGDEVEFGVYSTMYLASTFGPSVIVKALEDFDVFRLSYALVRAIDDTDEMAEEKKEAKKISVFLKQSSTEDIKQAIQDLGGDQVDIDHILQALGRDDE